MWVINETFHQIYVFSNDGSKLLKTLGEKNVPGKDGTHFAKPQDVAFLPDGRILVADGLDNHRVMILDRNVNYLGGVRRTRQGARPVQRCARGRGRTPGHDLRPRSLGRPDQRVQDDVRSDQGRVRGRLCRLPLPLDLIVNDDSLWVTDLRPLRFVKLDFKGNHLYNWLVPKDLPDGYLEVHTIPSTRTAICTAATISTAARRSSCRSAAPTQGQLDRSAVGGPQSRLIHHGVERRRGWTGWSDACKNADEEVRPTPTVRARGG